MLVFPFISVVTSIVLYVKCKMVWIPLSAGGGGSVSDGGGDSSDGGGGGGSGDGGDCSGGEVEPPTKFS